MEEKNKEHLKEVASKLKVKTYMGLVRVNKSYLPPHAIITIGEAFVTSLDKGGKTGVECPVCGGEIILVGKGDHPITHRLVCGCETIDKNVTNINHGFLVVLLKSGPRIYEYDTIAIAEGVRNRMLEDFNRALTTRYIFTSPVAKPYGAEEK